MKLWFHSAASAISTRLTNTETWKDFPSGGGAQTKDVSLMGDQTTKTGNPTGSATSTYSGPIGNTVTYTLYDANPRNTSGAARKGNVEASFGNSNHPTRQGILSLQITHSNGNTVTASATDSNQPYLQGIFDRLQAGLRKSFDLSAAISKIDSAAVDLGSGPTTRSSMPAKAFNVGLRP